MKAALRCKCITERAQSSQRILLNVEIQIKFNPCSYNSLPCLLPSPCLSSEGVSRTSLIISRITDDTQTVLHSRWACLKSIMRASPGAKCFLTRARSTTVKYPPDSVFLNVFLCPASPLFGCVATEHPAHAQLNRMCGDMYVCVCGCVCFFIPRYILLHY